jgi:hypothetical protein
LPAFFVKAKGQGDRFIVPLLFLALPDTREPVPVRGLLLYLPDVYLDKKTVPGIFSLPLQHDKIGLRNQGVIVFGLFRCMLS